MVVVEEVFYDITPPTHHRRRRPIYSEQIATIFTIRTDLMVNFTVGDSRHIVELQIAHAKMLTARKGTVVVMDISSNN